MQLKDKVAIITGGDGILGHALVRAYLAEGAKVVISDRHPLGEEFVQELNETDGAYLALQCDVTDSVQVKEMFDKTVEHFGTVDILINNAGMLPQDEFCLKYKMPFFELQTKPVPRHSLNITANVSDEDWKRFFEVNVHGTFYCTREALKIMEARKSGRVINISSIGGISAQSAFAPHYCASKAAVVGFTKSVAMEVAGAGISVNAIAPGSIATPVYERMFAEMTADEKASFFQLIPLGRVGEPEEYASLAVWLGSDNGGYMVGQILSPNGGAVI
mgnify:CR=1 FL=1